MVAEAREVVHGFERMTARAGSAADGYGTSVPHTGTEVPRELFGHY